jgi:uncharacterized protein (DUF697 family)
VDFTDTPGVGTAHFSLERVLESGILDRQHVVIHVLNGAAAISAEDQALHEALEKSSTHRCTVVNKVDLLDPSEQEEFSQSMWEKLGLRTQDFLFVSAKRGTGVAELVHQIADALPEAMQDAFIAQQQADRALKEKRIRTLIYGKAALCAGVAMTPVPVADIFVLTPIQLALVTSIGYLHGVELTRSRAAEFMGTVAAGVGLREASRQLLKLIPGLGGAVSAGVAFAGTVALGEAANLWFANKMRLSTEELQARFREVAESARAQYEAHRGEAEAHQEELAQLRQQLAQGEISPEAFEQAVDRLAGL